MLVEELDQLCEVRQRASKAVDLVDDDDVDLAEFNLRQKHLQGRTIKRCSGKRPVVIMIGDEAPTFMCLALDIGLAGFALSVERIELEVKIVLGRFPGIHRAAEKLAHWFLGTWLHGATLGPLARTDERRRLSRGAALAGICSASVAPALRRPKNRGPFHFVPVISRAMKERLE